MPYIGKSKHPTFVLVFVTRKTHKLAQENQSKKKNYKHHTEVTKYHFIFLPLGSTIITQGRFKHHGFNTKKKECLPQCAGPLSV